MIWQADGEKSTCGTRSDPSVGGVGSGRAGLRAAGSRGTPINGMAHFSMNLARVVYCRVVCFISSALEDVVESAVERPSSSLKPGPPASEAPGGNAWLLRLAPRVGQ